MQQLYPESLVTRCLPVNYNPKDESAFINDFSRTIPATYLLTLQNAFITNEGVAYQNLKIVEESLVSPAHYKSFGWRYVLSQIIKKKRINLFREETYIFPFNTWSLGYFHWFTDVIPRIYSLKEYCENSVLLLPQSYNSFHIDSLAPFHFKDIYNIPNGAYVFANKVLMPTHTAPTGNYNEIIMNGIRDLYFNYYDCSKEQIPHKKIYISRAKALRRKIRNEHEVESVLKAYGFQILYFEDLSFSQQIAICCSTEVIISQHGAGLTNMLFMKPGSKVMEFRREGDSTNLCYFSLASALKLKYYYQFGEAIDNSRTTFDGDIGINILELEKNIRVILNQ